MVGPPPIRTSNGRGRLAGLEKQRVTETVERSRYFASSCPAGQLEIMDLADVGAKYRNWIEATRGGWRVTQLVHRRPICWDEHIGSESKWRFRDRQLAKRSSVHCTRGLAL